MSQQFNEIQRELLDIINSARGHQFERLNELIAFLTDEELKALKLASGKNLANFAQEKGLQQLGEGLRHRGVMPVVFSSQQKQESRARGEVQKPADVKDTAEAKARAETEGRAETKIAREADFLETNTENEVLNFVNDLINKHGLSDHIYECTCCVQLNRGDKRMPSPSARDETELALPKIMQKQFPLAKFPTIRILDLGSGGMKQLATLAGNLMKAGYNVELMMVDHKFKLNSANAMDHILNTAYAKKLALESNSHIESFKKILQELKNKYHRSAEVLGCFSSLESYKAVLAQKGPHQIKPPKHPWEGSSIIDSENAAFKDEYGLYSKTCFGKSPHLVTVIDDKIELGHAYGELELAKGYRRREVPFETLKQATDLMFEDLVQDISNFSNPAKSLSAHLTSPSDRVLYLTTQKLPIPELDFGYEREGRQVTIPAGEKTRIAVEILNVPVANPNQRTVVYSKDHNQTPALLEYQRYRATRLGL